MRTVEKIVNGKKCLVLISPCPNLPKPNDHPDYSHDETWCCECNMTDEVETVIQILS